MSVTQFLLWLGFHIHEWRYYTEYDEFQGETTPLHHFRECKGCKESEMWIVDCAALGHGASWMRL